MSFNPNTPRKIPIVKPLSGLGPARPFNSIQLGITTYCDRMCPGCICNIPYLDKHQHVDVDWIKNIAPKLQGLRLLQISGGEPTLHPEFQYITEHVREWFNPQMLMLITNGKNIVQYADILGHYDHLRITRYDATSYPDSPNNVTVIDDFKRVFKGPSRIYSKLSKHRLNRGGENSNPCGLGANDLAIIQWNKIYPCCSSPGMDPTIGIEITENWREELKEVKLPCNGCPFSPSDELYKCWIQRLSKERKAHKRLYEENENNIHKLIKENGYDEWLRKLKEKGIDMSITPLDVPDE